MDKIQKIREVLDQTALKAGSYLVENRKHVSVVQHKIREDIVTNIDLESEKIIIDSLSAAYPDWNIFSEEVGRIDKKSEYTFIIDPVDGTKEYIRGLPLFNVSIALKHKEEIIAAVVYRPAETVLYSGVMGLGAFHNGARMTPSKVLTLDKSFVYTYLPSFARHPDTFEKSWLALGKIDRSVYRLRSLADENTMCCWVAQGGCEAYVNISDAPKYWDIAPGICVAQAASCMVTDRFGKPLDQLHIDSVVISNGLIHDELLDIINT
ncbi:MAG: inositol monophosphatase [Patescibacteria group bacterium]|jgi:myo-inositol-1(or 4)-monophosphatase